MLKIQGAEVAADSAQSAIDALEGQLAATRSELDISKEALRIAVSQETIDAAVLSWLTETAKAKESAERLARVKAGYPEVSFDGRPDEYLQAYDELLTERTRLDPEGLGLIKAQTPKAAAEVVHVKDSRETMVENMRRASQRK